MEKFSKAQRQQINRYEIEEEQGLHKKTIYTETFYQQHEHNHIQYDVNKKVDEYIKVDENRKDFQIVNSNQYLIQSNTPFRKRNKTLFKEKNDMEYIDDNDGDNGDEIVVRNQILKY